MATSSRSSSGGRAAAPLPGRAPAASRQAAGRRAAGDRVPRRLQALRGGDVGLDQATFSIDRGEFVFLVGSTGSGKSTVMRLLIKELEPTERHDPRRRPRPERDHAQADPVLPPQHRRRVPGLQAAAEPDRATTTSPTRSRSPAAARKEIRDKVPDILRLTGLSTKLHNYPDQLSGGEQQRVSIARAFVNHPPLLLADEPTGNLDPETSIDIMRLLYRINRTGTTVLVATHDQAMVDKMRRRVLELSAGPDRPRRGHRPVHARREHARVRAPACAAPRRRRRACSR